MADETGASESYEDWDAQTKSVFKQGKAALKASKQQAKSTYSSWKKATRRREKKLNKVSASYPQARWGKYWVWKVTSEKLNPLSSISVSDEWEKVQKQKKGKDGKKKTVSYHRRAAAEIKLSYELHRDFFGKSFDIGKHINQWKKRMGKTGAFYLENRVLFSNKKFKLTGFEATDIESNAAASTSSAAIVMGCKINLTFTEVKSSKSAKTLYKGKSKKTSSKKPKKKSSKKGTVYTVTASALNLRKGAGTSSKVTGSKKKGQAVKVVEVKNGWAKLSSGEWCSTRYLKKK